LALQLAKSGCRFLNVGGKIRHFLQLGNFDDLVGGRHGFDQAMAQSRDFSSIIQ
jgi:hypothetical protein